MKDQTRGRKERKEEMCVLLRRRDRSDRMWRCKMIQSRRSIKPSWRRVSVFDNKTSKIASRIWGVWYEDLSMSFLRLKREHILYIRYHVALWISGLILYVFTIPPYRRIIISLLVLLESTWMKLGRELCDITVVNYVPRRIVRKSLIWTLSKSLVKRGNRPRS